MPQAKQSEDKADVLVIGAGPAGCAAAINAAPSGARTVLIEKDAFPRYRPGETLHPGVEPLFEQLGVSKKIEKLGFLRHREVWNDFDGHRHFIACGADSRGDWLGWQIPGERLDAILLAQAETLGVKVIQPCRAVTLLLEKGGLCGLQTNRGCIVAPVVIDATGHGRFLTRRRGYIPSRFRSLSATTRIFFRDVTWRNLPDCARPDYFVTGDAAAVLDPSSSHGVLRAMMTGIMAAHVIVGSTDLSISARQYRQWLQAWYQTDVEHLYSMFQSQ